MRNMPQLKYRTNCEKVSAATFSGSSRHSSLHNPRYSTRGFPRIRHFWKRNPTRSGFPLFFTGISTVVYKASTHLVEVLHAFPVRPLRVGVNVHLHHAGLCRETENITKTATNRRVPVRYTVCGALAAICFMQTLFQFMPANQSIRPTLAGNEGMFHVSFVEESSGVSKQSQQPSVSCEQDNRQVYGSQPNRRSERATLP